MALDIDYVRSQFPAFSAPNLQGQAFSRTPAALIPASR